ncbi:hypothetical protein HGRIS_004418 [Hohenbuehelia grisea]|uniref:Uncharacterized protein n=1 Tax=Hohenbuehelia grisea TaxID=104357 RepID=A0ABR3JDH2_9AGAR
MRSSFTFCIFISILGYVAGMPINVGSSFALNARAPPMNPNTTATDIGLKGDGTASSPNVTLNQATSGARPPEGQLLGDAMSPPGNTTSESCPIAKIRQLSFPVPQGTSSKRGLEPGFPFPAPPQYGIPREFLGYRGMTHRTARSYRLQNLQGAPVNSQGSHLGPGIYLTDDIKIAHEYAMRSVAKTIKEGNLARPSICAIFALDAQKWRSAPKVFLPPNAWDQKRLQVWMGGRQAMMIQAEWIRMNVLPSYYQPQGQQLLDYASSIVKLTNMNRDATCFKSDQDTGNQMVIPPNMIEGLYATQCTDYQVDDQQLPDFQLPTFPHFDYRDHYQQWAIGGVHFDYIYAESEEKEKTGIWNRLVNVVKGLR